MGLKINITSDGGLSREEVMEARDADYASTRLRWDGERYRKEKRPKDAGVVDETAPGYKVVLAVEEAARRG